MSRVSFRRRVTQRDGDRLDVDPGSDPQADRCVLQMVRPTPPRCLVPVARPPAVLASEVAALRGRKEQLVKLKALDPSGDNGLDGRGQRHQSRPTALRRGPFDRRERSSGGAPQMHGGLVRRRRVAPRSRALARPLPHPHNPLRMRRAPRWGPHAPGASRPTRTPTAPRASWPRSLE